MLLLPTLEELKTGSVLLVDKPLKWTSFDVVRRLRQPVGAKIGHCGTLDPLATGLLILCTGKMTKQIAAYQGMTKLYTGTIRLGATTPTYDLESEPQNHQPTAHLEHATIQRATKQFTGEIYQTPPIHSAIKTNGKRAYELARAGEAVELKSRPITISEFKITHIELPDVHFQVTCSTGTYIRSLANDFGAALGCGGYLKELRRTQIGDFRVEDAASTSEILDHIQQLKNSLSSE